MQERNLAPALPTFGAGWNATEREVLRSHNIHLELASGSQLFERRAYGFKMCDRRVASRPADQGESVAADSRWPHCVLVHINGDRHYSHIRIKAAGVSRQLFVPNENMRAQSADRFRFVHDLQKS